MLLAILGVAFLLSAAGMFASSYLMAELSKQTTVGANATLQVAQGDGKGVDVLVASPDLTIVELDTMKAVSNASGSEQSARLRALLASDGGDDGSTGAVLVNPSTGAALSTSEAKYEIDLGVQGLATFPAGDLPDLSKVRVSMSDEDDTYELTVTNAERHTFSATSGLWRVEVLTLETSSDDHPYVHLSAAFSAKSACEAASAGLTCEGLEFAQDALASDVLAFDTAEELAEHNGFYAELAEMDAFAYYLNSVGTSSRLMLGLQTPGGRRPLGFFKKLKDSAKAVVKKTVEVVKEVVEVIVEVVEDVLDFDFDQWKADIKAFIVDELLPGIGSLKESIEEYVKKQIMAERCMLQCTRGKDPAMQFELGHRRRLQASGRSKPAARRAQLLDGGTMRVTHGSPRDHRAAPDAFFLALSELAADLRIGLGAHIGRNATLGDAAGPLLEATLAHVEGFVQLDCAGGGDLDACVAAAYDLIDSIAWKDLAEALTPDVVYVNDDGSFARAGVLEWPEAIHSELLDSGERPLKRMTWECASEAPSEACDAYSVRHEPLTVSGADLTADASSDPALFAARGAAPNSNSTSEGLLGPELALLLLDLLPAGIVDGHDLRAYRRSRLPRARQPTLAVSYDAGDADNWCAPNGRAAPRFDAAAPPCSYGGPAPRRTAVVRSATTAFSFSYPNLDEVAAVLHEVLGRRARAWGATDPTDTPRHRALLEAKPAEARRRLNELTGFWQEDDSIQIDVDMPLCMSVVEYEIDTTVLTSKIKEFIMSTALGQLITEKLNAFSQDKRLRHLLATRTDGRKLLDEEPELAHDLREAVHKELGDFMLYGDVDEHGQRHLSDEDSLLDRASKLVQVNSLKVKFEAKPQLTVTFPETAMEYNKKIDLLKELNLQDTLGISYPINIIPIYGPLAIGLGFDFGITKAMLQARIAVEAVDGKNVLQLPLDGLHFELDVVDMSVSGGRPVVGEMTFPEIQLKASADFALSVSVALHTQLCITAVCLGPSFESSITFGVGVDAKIGGDSDLRMHFRKNAKYPAVEEREVFPEDGSCDTTGAIKLGAYAYLDMGAAVYLNGLGGLFDGIRAFAAEKLEGRNMEIQEKFETPSFFMQIGKEQCEIACTYNKPEVCRRVLSATGPISPTTTVARLEEKHGPMEPARASLCL